MSCKIFSCDLLKQVVFKGQFSKSFLLQSTLFSTLSKSGEKQNLPITKNGAIYLYSFDKNGNQINKQIIKFLEERPFCYFYFKNEILLLYSEN